MAEPEAILEIDYPSVQCSACQFTTSLSGQWSVEDGRLVFRADADPLRTRGPDFVSCGEGRGGAHPVVGIAVDYGQQRLSDPEFSELRVTAGVTLNDYDAEPPIGSRVEALGRIWTRWPEGYWIAEGSDEPESWNKVAGNYGPARLLR